MIAFLAEAFAAAPPLPPGRETSTPRREAQDRDRPIADARLVVDISGVRTIDPAQLKAAFESSQSGRGFRLASAEQLRHFADYVRAQDAVVCNVETYEMRGECEIPRI